MPTRTVFAFVLTFALSAPLALTAEENQTKAEATSRLAEDLVQIAGLPGMSIAIMQDGNLVFADGLGLADVESQTPVTTQTQFRTASVAKLVTATLICKLVDEGKIDLDANVQEFVPDFVKKQSITIRQLSGHLSGMAHYGFGDRLQRPPTRRYTSVHESLDVFRHQPLLTKPGTSYRYTTHGYTLLGAVASKAADMPFLDALDETLFQPLEMNSTGPNLINAEGPHMSSLYVLKEGKLTEDVMPEDPSYKWPSGGLISRPIDLVRMGNAYLNGFIKPETGELAFTSQKLASGVPTNVGIGWRVTNDHDGRRIAEHAGGMSGARTILCVYPDDNLVLAIMANARWNSTIEQTAHVFALPWLNLEPVKGLLQGQYHVTGEFKTHRINRTIDFDDGRGILIHKDGSQLAFINGAGSKFGGLVTSSGVFRIVFTQGDEHIYGQVFGTHYETGSPVPDDKPIGTLTFKRRTPAGE